LGQKIQPIRQFPLARGSVSLWFATISVQDPSRNRPRTRYLLLPGVADNAPQDRFLTSRTASWDGTKTEDEDEFEDDLVAATPH